MWMVLQHLHACTEGTHVELREILKYSLRITGRVRTEDVSKYSKLRYLISVALKCKQKTAHVIRCSKFRVESHRVRDDLAQSLHLSSDKIRMHESILYRRV